MPPVVESGYVSKIWKDIVGLAHINPALLNYYLEKVEITIGNGRRIMFWVDAWKGESSLSWQFPRLYQLSVEKEISLSMMLSRKDLAKEWCFCFRRLLHAWEEDETGRLISLLGVGLYLHLEQGDSMRWKANQTGVFKVSTVYEWCELVNGTSSSSTGLI